METKFPKGILEESFVIRNQFSLNQSAKKIENVRLDDKNDSVTRGAGTSRDSESSSYYGYDYYYFNYDYIWWWYLCDSNYGYYPVSFYHRNYYDSGDAGQTAAISVYSGGDVSGGGGTVDGGGDEGVIMGDDGGAFGGDDPIEIDGGDGGEANGGFDDGAGHDTFADGGDGGDGGGDGAGDGE